MVEIVEEMEESEVDSWLEGFYGELSRIEKLVDTEPWRAYSDLILAISSLNFIGLRWPKRRPGIISRLSGWIQKIRTVLEKLAKSLSGVRGFSIGVAVPFGVSASIEFTI